MKKARLLKKAVVYCLLIAILCSQCVVVGAAGEVPYSRFFTMEINLVETPDLIEGAANVGEGSAVGVLSALGGQAPITYALVTGDGINDEDNAKFAIIGAEVIVAEGVALTAGTYAFLIEATDAEGEKIQQGFAITVAEAEEEVAKEEEAEAEEELVVEEEVVDAELEVAPMEFGLMSQQIVCLWDHGVPGIPLEDFQFERDGTSGSGGMNFQPDYGHLHMRAASVTYPNNTYGAIARYRIKNIDLTGVREVGVWWKNTGNFDAQSRLIIGTSQISRNGTFTTQNATLLLTSISGVHDIVLESRVGAIDNASSDLYVYQLYKVMEQYNISIASTPDKGTVTGGGTYYYGESVTLTAIPDEGYAFEKWTSTAHTGEITHNPWTFDAPPTDAMITPYFKPLYTINASATAGGSVSGAGDYLANALVTLTATPNEGYEFVNWTEDGEEVSTNPHFLPFNATADRSLVANFRIKVKDIRVTANPSWAGTVSGEGSYDWGTSVTATAEPREDYQFLNWTLGGSVVSQDETYQFQAQSSQELVANFMLKPGTFSAQPHSQFAGESITFSAADVFAVGGEGYTHLWDFGDGTTANGITVNHTYGEAGEYEVSLEVRDGMHPVVERTRFITISEMLPLKQSEFRASPQGIVSAKPGATVVWDVFFANNGVPLANRQIQVVDEVTNSQSAITTDQYGRANYQLTVPGGHPFDLKQVSFSHENLTITRGVQIFENNVRLTGKAFDFYTGKPLTGVTISVGGKTARTDAQGNYQITGLTSGLATVSASLTEKYKVENREVSLDGLSVVQNFSLQRYPPTMDPFIGRVYSEETDSNSRKESFISAGQDRNLTFKVGMDWRDNEPGEIVFITPRGEETIAANVGQKTFNIKDLKVGDRLHVKAISAHGVESNTVDASFEISQPSPVKTNTSNFILPTVETPPIADLPFLGGLTMGLDLGNVPVEVDFDEEEGQMVVSLGWKILDKSSGPDDNSPEDMKKLWDELNKRRNMGKTLTGQKIASAEVMVGGKLVFIYDSENKTWPLREGYIIVKAEGEIGYRVYYLTPVLIPLYGEIAAGAGAEAEFGLAWDSEKEELILIGRVSPEIYVRIAVGAGIAGTLSAEGWGRASGHMEIVYLPPRAEGNKILPPRIDIEDKYVQISTGYKITAFLYSYSRTLWNQRWPAAGTRMMSMSMPEVNELKIMPRDYAREESVWMPTTFTTFGIMAADTSNGDETTMQSNVFPNADPKLTMIDGARMLVWLQDDSTRSDINRTSLVYSTFDGQDWSAPSPISNDGTADFNPEIVRIPGGAIAAWVNTASVLDNSASLGDLLKAGEIAVAFYDNRTQRWIRVQNLTNDDLKDSMPKIDASGDKTMVVWVKNTATDYPVNGSLNSVLFPQPDDIMFAKWDGTSWTNPELVVEQAGAIINGALAYDGNNAVYAYTIDVDADLATIDDQELYVVRYNSDSGWASPIRVTNNDVQDANPKVSFVNGDPMLFWYQDGKILYLENLDGAEPKTIVEGTATSSMADFSLATRNRGEISVVWAEGEGEAQEIYTSVFDSDFGRWSKKIRLTANGAINRSIDTTLDAEGNILAAYVKQVVEVDEISQQIIADRTDLVFNKLTVGRDLAVTAEDITLSEGNPMPGSTVTVTATIHNVGELADQNIPIAFYDGDPLRGGEQIGETQVVTDIVAAGESKPVSVEWVIPTAFTTRHLYVVIDPENEKADRDRYNNIASVQVILPDLEVVDVDWEPMGGNYLVTATVANRGYANAQDVTVTVYKERVGGEILELKNISSLSPGQVIQETFNVSFTDSDFVDNMLILYIKAASSNEDFSARNTVQSTVVRRPRAFTGGPVTGLDLNKPTLALSVGSEETLIEILTPFDATNRSVTWESSNPSVAYVDGQGKVRANQVGDAVITVTSLENNELTATSLVSVLTPPEIRLRGSETVQLIMGAAYNEEGTEVIGTTEAVEIGGDTVDTSTPGVYRITYNVTGSGGNAAAEVVRTVIVAPPVPNVTGSISGANTLGVANALPHATLNLKNNNNELVATATLAGTTTAKTFTSVPPAATYYVTQTVNGVESSPSQAVDITPPSIFLNGDNVVNIVMGSNYVDAGATAFDLLNGNVSSAIVVTDLPNTAIPGRYVVKYNVSDAAGNAGREITRTVMVEPRAVTATGGLNFVRASGAIPGSSLTLYDSVAQVSATAIADLNGRYTFESVPLGRGYYVVQAVNTIDSVPSNSVHTLGSTSSGSSSSDSSSRTAGDISRDLHNSIQRNVDTNADGKKVQTYTVPESVGNIITNLKNRGEATLLIELDKYDADITVVNIPANVLQRIDNMSMQISLGGTSLELPAAVIEVLAAENKELSISIQQGNADMVTDQMQGVVGTEGAKVLGQPTVIQTAITGNTVVTIPLTGIQVPKDTAERQKLLDSLAVFVIHSDDGKEIVNGDIVYNQSGDPIGIRFIVDRFSTFAVLQMETTPEPGHLTDINGHWAENSIKELVELGVISGYPDGSFRPNQNMTRAEFAVVVVKAFNLSKQTGIHFTDTAEHWAKDYINIAVSNGIATGYNESEFGPNDLITREQMAVMICNVFKPNSLIEEEGFSDHDQISDWAKDGVYAAKAAGMIHGYPDNTFKPKNNATRAEAVTIVINAVKK